MDPQSHNPYQPPSSPSPDSQIDDTPYPTSLGRRFGNLAIDSIVIGAITTGLVSVLGEAAFELGLGLQAIAYGLAYVLPEAAFGRTVGKLVTGTKVVNLQGGKPSIGQVLARTAIRFVPFEPLSFVWGDPTGWHDNWSKTLVVPNTDPYAHIQ